MKICFKFGFSNVCEQAVTAIAYPSGGDKLYSGSIDGTLRVWNCHTGQCEHVIDLGAEVCSLIQEGPWIFVGLPNLVKVLHISCCLQL